MTVPFYTYIGVKRRNAGSVKWKLGAGGVIRRLASDIIIRKLAQVF